MAAFRVGSEDAKFLEQQFSPVFEAKDLMNVPNYNALVRVLANGIPTKPFSIATLPPIKSDLTRLAEIIEISIKRFGRPRAEVEAEISARYMKKTAPAKDLSGIL
jgi:hypothetical protein